MEAFEVVDWRRRTFALYAEVRDAADPAAGHARWVAGRDELFATHPASPLLPEHRDGFTGLPVPPYDPAWRFEVEVSCAHDPRWACPLAPAGNLLACDVPAGEISLS